MPFKSLFRLALLTLGTALLITSLLMRGTAHAQEVATPTPDRLAQPTLPALPSQADRGAQVYWLSCLPCHGDVGQGLTDEFRMTYPPEEQFCWESGCHGNKPYDSGFTIPKTIPAVIGAGALQKFPNAFVLHAYIKAAMPYWRPGMLTDEESWQVTAFLLRENRILSNDTELNETNAAQIMVGLPIDTPTPQPSFDAYGNLPFSIIPVMILGVLAVCAFFYSQSRKNRDSS